MTNKQERYFVVSESELEDLRYAGYTDIQSEIDKAEAACRAREVFWFDVGKAWVGVEK